MLFLSVRGEGGYDTQAAEFDEEGRVASAIDVSIEHQETQNGETDSRGRKHPSEDRECVVISSAEL